MKLWLPCLAVLAFGQITVTEPDDTDTISGFSFDLTVDVSGEPTTASIEWYIDQRLRATVTSAPYTYNITTYEWWNGAHKVYAVAKDSGGSVLATSTENAFTIANGTDTIAVTPSTAFTSTWSGTVTFAVAITVTDSDPTNCILYVDGVFKQLQYLDMGGDCNSLAIDTTTLENGTRRVFIQASNAFFNSPRGEVEHNVTVSNTATNQVSVESSSEVWLAVSGTYQLTCRVRLADSSTGNCTSPTYVSDDEAVATVTSGGLVTAEGVGDAVITVTSGSLEREVRVSVNTANTLPHFGRDGTLLTTFEQGNSIPVLSWFFSDYEIISNMVSQYSASGSNSFESTFYLVPPTGQSQASYEYDTAGYRDALEAFHASTGLYLVGIGDGLARDQTSLYKATRGVWRTWTPDPVTDAFQWAWDSGFTIGIEMVDEVNFAHGNTPFPPGLVGTGGFTNIVSDGADNCTANWTNASTNGAHLFILSGATTDTDLNSTTGNLFAATNITTNSFDFSCSSVGAGTYDSMSDAGLTMEMLASAWISTDYVRYDAFDTIIDLANATTNRNAIAWPVAGSSDTLSKTNWNAVGVADYASMYWAATTRRHHYGEFLHDMLGDMRTAYQGFYPVIQRDKPFLMLTPAAGPMYRAGGVPVDITDIDTDGVVTFDAAHGISSVTQGLTRITVTGSSDLNGDFYVISAPTSTTARVYYESVVNTGTGFGGTATFDTSQAFTVISLQVDGSTHVLTVTDPGGCELQDQLYHSFVMSGSSNGALNRTWYFAGPTAPSCTAAEVIKEVPAVSSTGGTAYVITTNAYVAGRNQLMVQGIHPRNVTAGIMWSFIQGAAGVRNYALSNVNPDDDANASRWFQNEPSSGDGLNYNSGPLYNVNGMTDRWNAAAVATQVITDIYPALFQPRLPSLDYGPVIDCTHRSGVNGAMIACINTSEGSLARTFDISGLPGNKVRYRVTEYGTTTASVTSSTDALTIGPGETILWLQSSGNRVSGGTTISGGITIP